MRNTDDKAPLADVGDLAKDVERRLKERKHPKGRSNLEESEEMEVVAGGEHAQGEQDHHRAPDVKTQLPPAEVRHGAEYESAENYSDHR